METLRKAFWGALGLTLGMMTLLLGTATIFLFVYLAATQSLLFLFAIPVVIFLTYFLVFIIWESSS